MKAPIGWLKDYVNIDVSEKEFEDRLVMTGNGVEEIIRPGENLVNVVVGRILSLNKHENADKLQVCAIDVGDKTVQIVTGATNVSENALVPVALDNSVLPNGTQIKKGELRGVLSEGMLCSGEELCLDDDFPGADVNGILILSEEYKPGDDMKDVLMLNDTIFDFEVGANRPDCLSMLGIAREAASALNTEFKMPDVDIPDLSELPSLKVTVADKDLCPRYMAKRVKNVKIEPSPDWMRRRLKAAGVRAINNIVDITNFVMLETGQPMHAFDARQITGDHIIVRRATEGERMNTLDGKERTFTSNMLLIADEGGPIGIAGVMGGEDSEIKPDTTDVVFESAKFMYGNIRQTSRGLGLSTESSMRFSKGVDAVMTEYALFRACELVEQLCAGEVADGHVDVLSMDLSPTHVTTSVQAVNALLGTDIGAKDMTDCLKRVHIETELIGDTLNCTIPHFRGDIEGDAHIAEEVARIFGYDNIPEAPIMTQNMRVAMINNDTKTDILKIFLASNGFYECVTYSFMSETVLEKLELPATSPFRNAVRLKNPMGEDTAYMRTTMIPDMLEVVATNLKQKNTELRLYETGRIYRPKSLPITELPEELEMLSIAISGKDCDFYLLKGYVENLMTVLNIRDYHFNNDGGAYFHPGRKACIYAGDELVGEIGETHPTVQQNFGINQRVYIVQLNIGALFDMNVNSIKFRTLPRYPAMQRDICLTVDKHVASDVLRRCILENGGAYLEHAEVFDVYEGEKLGPDKKSIAYTLRFRSEEGTLSEEDIAKPMEDIIDNLARAGALLREQ